MPHPEQILSFGFQSIPRSTITACNNLSTSSYKHLVHATAWTKGYYSGPFADEGRNPKCSIEEADPELIISEGVPACGI